ncbi:MAG: prephenate dehydrogenase/arogenate dehydrogenase family protein [Candidatus Gracilibacteria bacterium]|nr:prephenate dehydrogenase/arogenate dehydrogenase family protein [Candidatus Gracilibacteria bacterium]
MKHIFIPGGFGSHGKDLINRGIFSGSDKLPIIVRSNQKIIFPGNYAIITPIKLTCTLIENILTLDSNSVQIVNFAGIMGTSPNVDGRVTNIHCLFGPGVTENLNAIVTKNKNDFSLLVERNLENAGVNLIELSPAEHDKNMAIIQGLAHFCEILLGMYFKDNKDVINLLAQWKTSENVIEDMITLNPYFTIILEKILLGIKSGKDLAEIFLSLSLDNIDNDILSKIKTPNFQRVLYFFLTHKGFYIDDSNFIIDNLKSMISIARN